MAATSSSKVQRAALHLPYVNEANQLELLASLTKAMTAHAPSAELIKIEPRLGGGWRVHVDLYLDEATRPQAFVNMLYGEDGRLIEGAPWETYTAGLTDWADV